MIKSLRMAAGVMVETFGSLSAELTNKALTSVLQLPLPIYFRAQSALAIEFGYSAISLYEKYHDIVYLN